MKEQEFKVIITLDDDSVGYTDNEIMRELTNRLNFICIDVEEIKLQELKK